MKCPFIEMRLPNEFRKMTSSRGRAFGAIYLFILVMRLDKRATCRECLSSLHPLWFGRVEIRASIAKLIASLSMGPGESVTKGGACSANPTLAAAAMPA